jgi:hypothetical protein
VSSHGHTPTWTVYRETGRSSLFLELPVKDR